MSNKSIAQKLIGLALLVGLITPLAACNQGGGGGETPAPTETTPAPTETTPAPGN